MQSHLSTQLFVYMKHADLTHVQVVNGVLQLIGSVNSVLFMFGVKIALILTDPYTQAALRKYH